MTVASILAQKGTNVITIGPDRKVSDAVAELGSNGVGAIVVLEKNGQVCGILSERDVVREIARRGADILGHPISACMTRDVISCSKDDTIDQVMEVMTARRFRHLPVITDGRLAGIISIGDVVKRKIEQAERDAEELRNYIATG